MTVIHLAAPLIRQFEGLRLTAYQDASPKKNWTIGYGHTGYVDGAPIIMGMTITEEKAEELLANDAAPLLTAVAGRPIVEAAALVSFGFNCGLGALQKVIAGTSKLEEFTHAAGKVLPGLVARRELEGALIAASKQNGA